MYLVEHEDIPSIGDLFIEVDEFGLTKILRRMAEFKDVYLEVSVKRSEANEWIQINFGGRLANYGDFVSITGEGKMRVLKADQFSLAVDLFAERDVETQGE